jgi:hypothetical protein
MDGKSFDIKKDKPAKLKDLFPEEFTEDKANREKLKAVLGEVLCLDKLFAGNDQLKTNTVLQMRDAGIEFKTV